MIMYLEHGNMYSDNVSGMRLCFSGTRVMVCLWYQDITMLMHVFM